MKKKQRKNLIERASDWDLYWLQRQIEVREHNERVARYEAAMGLDRGPGY